MSETEKRKIRVFIASPNDLAEERRIFRKAIDQLNIGFGDGANVEFLPLGWEDTLASTGRRNQGVINADIDSCDVFILAMHRRWGQDAPDAAPYSSYTEEEFHRALERWKKSNSPEIFVFFKRVDAASEADPGVQLSKVIKFRQHLEETCQILYHYFDSPDSFLKEVDTHLRAYAKGELPKADEQRDIVVLPLDALEEVKKAKQIAEQKTEEARQANDKAEIERLKRDTLELQMAEDAAKLSKEGKIEFAREKFTKLVTETTNLRILFLGYEYFCRTGDLDSAFKVLEKSLSISGAENKTEETAVVFNNLGILYRRRGDLDRAEEIHKKALVINEELGRKEGIAITYSNLGIVYEKQGNLERAEEMYEKALVINEELGRTTGMSIVYGNLGIVFEKRGDFQRAEEMYRKALAIDEALGRTEFMANQYGNLGNLYATRGDLDRAEEMYQKVLGIDEILGRKESIANAYSNLGIVYKDRGDVKMAEKMYQKAIVLFKEIGSPTEKEVTEWLRELKSGESPSEDGVEA